MGLFFELERDATNAGVGTINALFMVGGKIIYLYNSNYYHK